MSNTYFSTGLRQVKPAREISIRVRELEKLTTLTNGMYSTTAQPAARQNNLLGKLRLLLSAFL